MSLKNVLLLLVVVCVVVSTNAQLLPQFPFPFPFQPTPGMPGLPDITKCWSSVMNIPGCITEISQAILNGRFSNIGPACCKAFLEAEANCMPKVSFNPFFPPMLKEQCSRLAGSLPPTTK
ncbi:predicted protein [Arabidopsis lyrata subsp. lyrata]|uniref:Predicted protein n=1 Tax=Arabidopsis lyrata subsp. lyrata TaxID=81972 RepID=D7KKS8_ARALL|nr:uncharacterized protein LOC9328640 [Arabidopsis lyrata subsp. lyrata]EFH68837.1 predicted protein [Arabidopsis lyrata subsp. lyrata]|eukprot:XP_020868841.1 uncharacterized protein LOC9328640 [Arabidopsis lyrata subsp. lyrata]